MSQRWKEFLEPTSGQEEGNFRDKKLILVSNIRYKNDYHA